MPTKVDELANISKKAKLFPFASFLWNVVDEVNHGELGTQNLTQTWGGLRVMSYLSKISAAAQLAGELSSLGLVGDHLEGEGKLMRLLSEMKHLL